jgi:eukaryotic-like serine/threonine-protein kinase
VLSDSTLDRLHQVVVEPDVAGTRYELVSILGRGGMAVVYLARDTRLDREVALKVLDWSVDRTSRERLSREAHILARLEHPGIVPVHDVGQLPDGRLFYAMKRVRGDRLDRWLALLPALHARLGVFLRICDAVAFAHAHGVIHRDLKPENVMIGPFGEVLVLDWGVARVAAGSEIGPSTSAAGTGHGVIVGTRDYMAPEQARGDATIDERADIFALGTMLAGIIDGQKPLQAIAAKATSSDRADRYPDVRAMTDDVSRFMAQLAVEAHHETIVERAVRIAEKYRLPIALVLTYLAMRLLLAWAYRL